VRRKLISILLVAVLCTMGASVPSGALKAMEPGEISGGGLVAAAPPQTLELISQMGGPTYAAVVEGNLLYFGVGPRLVIWDVSDPTAPLMVGQTGMLRDVVVDVDVAGGYAYLACERGGLRVVDVSDPAVPREVGSYQIDGLPTEAFAVDVVGDTAYVADRIRGLRVVDVSAPTNPQEVGAYDTDGFAMDVTVVGQYAYVADESYGLGVIDVSVPGSPAPVDVDSYSRSYVYGVTADGGRLYVATADGLDVLSLADPAAPTLLGSYESEDLALDVVVSGEVAYLVADGLEVLDISTLASIERLGVFPTEQRSTGCPAEGGYSFKPCRAVTVGGSHAYVADDGFGLHVVDVADGQGPERVAGYQGLGRAGDVAVWGSTAVVAERGRGAHVLNISDPATPSLLGRYPLTGTVDAVALEGTTLYVGEGYPGDSGLHVVSIANPGQPVQMGHATEVGEPNHVTLRGDYAYLTTGYEWDGFQIVDVSDPTGPASVGSVVYPGVLAGGHDVALDGERAYVADQGAVRLMNVADPTAPYTVSVHYRSGPAYVYSVATDGEYVYYTDWSDVGVIDWTDPVSPTEVSGLSSAIGWGLDIVLGGDAAYVAAEQYGVFLVDRSDPLNLSIVQQVRTPGEAWQLAWVDGLLYAALGDGGLAIFAANATSAGSIPTTGGGLTAPDGEVGYQFPSGAFTSTVVVTHTTLVPAQVPAPTGGLLFGGPVFGVEATYVESGEKAEPGSAYTMTVRYDPEALGPVKEESLGIHYWDGTRWQRTASGPPDTVFHELTAHPSHFSYWAVLGETERLFLPLVIRSRTE